MGTIVAGTIVAIAACIIDDLASETGMVEILQCTKAHSDHQ